MKWDGNSNQLKNKMNLTKHFLYYLLQEPANMELLETFFAHPQFILSRSFLF
jgi:hypothetical protein